MPTYMHTSFYFHNCKQWWTLNQQINACLPLPLISSCGQRGIRPKGDISCEHKVDATKDPENTPQNA